MKCLINIMFSHMKWASTLLNGMKVSMTIFGFYLTQIPAY